MATKITPSGIIIRFLVALVLVFATYNPFGWSYLDWIRAYIGGQRETSLPLSVLSGVVLVILWTVYLRATMRSLGAFGLVLAFAFFGALLWLAIDTALIPITSTKAIITLILVMFAGVLAIGMSWSHIRRRISGQADVDDVDM